MMGIVVPETCWAYKKYNKTASGSLFVFIHLHNFSGVINIKKNNNNKKNNNFVYCQTTLCIPPVEKHWAVPPRYCYMQHNAAPWKVERGGGDE